MVVADRHLIVFDIFERVLTNFLVYFQDNAVCVQTVESEHPADLYRFPSAIMSAAGVVHRHGITIHHIIGVLRTINATRTSGLIHMSIDPVIADIDDTNVNIIDEAYPDYFYNAVNCFLPTFSHDLCCICCV